MTVIAFLSDQIAALADRYEVTVAANLQGDFGLELDLHEVGTEHLPIRRSVDIVRDIAAVIAAVRLFRRHRFDVVHSVTPKAGLVAMTGAFLARVPVRIHMFTGQVWATTRGGRRMLLKNVDRLTARLATDVYADSASQADFLAREGVLDRESIKVLADGSISGVDTRRFAPDPEARSRIRSALHLPPDSFVILFVGRLTMDKGVFDLVAAFRRLEDLEGLYLLFVGPDEANLQEGLVRQAMESAQRIRFVGFTVNPEQYMAASDVLCLPSYREGFGSVVIEAAACGIPAVATRIYGVTDAVVDGETGLLCEPHDSEDLSAKLRRVINDGESRARMATAASTRALNLYSTDRLTQAVVDEYHRLLELRS